jgi:hypothetical protein
MNTRLQRRFKDIAHQRLAAPLLAASFAVIATFESATAEVPHILLHSLFDPGTSAQAGALQGYSVAVDGNIAVAGAPGVPVVDDRQAENSGVVKVYDATTGGLLHTLNNPSPAVPYSESWVAGVDDKFGCSVAVSGTRVVVGAPYDNVETTFPGYFYTDAGTAYVYDLASATPTVPVATLTNPGPEPSVSFGYSVAVSGTRVVVGAPGGGSEGGGGEGIAYVYDLASATPSVSVITLANPNPQYQAHFGTAVAIAGARVVVGAPNDNTGATASGIAYLYDLNSATPATPVATLINPSPATDDRFGYSVALSGTRLVVGAPYDDDGSNDAGSAYVYDLANATPTLAVATLVNPSQAQFNCFAFSVAISGTRLVVGTHLDDTVATGAPSAYVYDLTSATPNVPVTRMNNPGPAAADFFGFAVAVADSRVLVGAPHVDAPAIDAGCVYLYDLTSATPAAPVATLNDPSPAAGDHAGSSVAISGTRVVVGAYGDDTGAENAGSAYVYDLASATPTVPVATLNNPSPAEREGGNRFGGSVAVSGVLVVVGTPFDGANVGITYVYDLSSATPALPVATLTNPSPAVADWFGWSVSVSGTRVIVGAPHDDIGGADAGSAYVYDLASATPTVPLATLTNPSPAVSGSFGRSVAISSTRLVVGAPYDNTETHGGSAYVYDLASATPTVPVTTLDNPSPSGDDYFGSSVGISGTRVVVGAPDEGAYVGGAYVYDLVSATPAVPVATLNNPNPEGSLGSGTWQFDHFGSSVAISGTRVVVGAPYENTATDGGIAYVYELVSATPTVPVGTLSNPSPAGYDRFGLSLAVDGTAIIVGDAFDNTTAPDRGAAYVFGPSQPSTFLHPSARHSHRRGRHGPSFVTQSTENLSPTNWIHGQ